MDLRTSQSRFIHKSGCEVENVKLAKLKKNFGPLVQSIKMFPNLLLRPPVQNLTQMITVKIRRFLAKCTKCELVVYLL